MKIVFIGGRDIRALGGIESYMLNLATELVRMGHEPIVFCESDHDGEECINGFQVIYQKGSNNNLICKPWLGLKATVRAIRNIKNVDVIHYNAWPPSLWSPIARLFGIKSVMQGHGLEWMRSKYSPIQQKIMKFMEWYTAHLNRNLIMCSKDQTHYFQQHYNRQATTIPTAVNLPNLSKPNNSDILKRFGLQPNSYFLFLARLVQDKNPDYLIKAFCKANTEGYKLVIAGNNPADPQYVQYLHDLSNSSTDIIFTDAVYGADKEQLLKNAFMFCIPSTIEGLSISLLEAMSYKLPIIASDIPANKEVLEKDKAIWVRPENTDDLIQAYRYGINNHTNLTAAAKYNYDIVSKYYTWTKVTEKYVTYLQSLLQNKIE